MCIVVLDDRDARALPLPTLSSRSRSPYVDGWMHIQG